MYGLRGAAAPEAARLRSENGDGFKKAVVNPISSHALRSQRRHAARMLQENKIKELQAENRTLRYQLSGGTDKGVTHMAVPTCIAHRVEEVVESLMQHRQACIIAGRNIHNAGISAAVAASLDEESDYCAARAAHRRRNVALHEAIFSDAALNIDDPFQL